jgi:G3E family GTPase
MAKKAIPVTLITGFLGAGKTSLLNEVLKENPKANFLIIENEVGNVNIDSSLVKQNANSKLFELTSGCICCSLNTELGTLLNSIILSGFQYDYILIEATGVADPSQIISMFTGVRIQRYFKLDSVVCIVDANSFINRVDEFEEAYKQIAESDMLLINKCDLVSFEQLKEVEERVAAINPFAKVEKTEFGKLKGSKILDSELFQPDKTEKSIIDFSNLSIVKPTQNHTHQIQSIAVKIPGSFRMDRVSSWFEDYLMFNYNKVLRIKGVLSIEDMKHKIIIQSVGPDYQITQGNLWGQDEKHESNIVFIGTDLNENEIREGLNSLL